MGVAHRRGRECSKAKNANRLFSVDTETPGLVASSLQPHLVAICKPQDSATGITLVVGALFSQCLDPTGGTGGYSGPFRTGDLLRACLGGLDSGPVSAGESAHLYLSHVLRHESSHRSGSCRFSFRKESPGLEDVTERIMGCASPIQKWMVPVWLSLDRDTGTGCGMHFIDKGLYQMLSVMV